MTNCLVSRASSDVLSIEMVDTVSPVAAVVATSENPPCKPPSVPINDVSWRCCRALLTNRKGWVALAALACWETVCAVVLLIDRLLYVDDGGRLARVLHADGIGVLTRVLDAGDVATVVFSQLLLHFAPGVAESHEPVERTPLGPVSTVVMCCFSLTASRRDSSGSRGRTWGNHFGSYIEICRWGEPSRLDHIVHAWPPRGPQ